MSSWNHDARVWETMLRSSGKEKKNDRYVYVLLKTRIHIMRMRYDPRVHDTSNTLSCSNSTFNRSEESHLFFDKKKKKEENPKRLTARGRRV